MCGLYFALRIGQEHRNLQLRQLQLVEPAGGVPYIEYTENVSKNHPGGLKHREIEPKKVKHHANYQRPERCFVRLFKYRLYDETEGSTGFRAPRKPILNTRARSARVFMVSKGI